MGVSMGVAKNADRLNAMNFPEVTRYAQITDPNNPTGGYILDNATGTLHDFVSFMFAQKKTSAKPDLLYIVCSSMYSDVSGTVENNPATNANVARIFRVNVPIQYACSLGAMPTYDSTSWSGSYSPSADAKLSKVQLGFTYLVTENGRDLANIRFGW